MKLSEAIRLGSMMKPQIYGEISSGQGTCALGAAIEAAGLTPEPAVPGIVTGSGRITETAKAGDIIIHTPEAWHAFFHGYHPCPACRVSSYGMRAIGHLNDEHRWTRERIADWVETIENRGPEEQTKDILEPKVILNNDLIVK